MKLNNNKRTISQAVSCTFLFVSYSCYVLFIIIRCEATEPFQQIALPPRSATNQNMALLVGCSTYDHLDNSRQLAGPANDVNLMNRILIERFGFSGDRIVRLSEDGGRLELRPLRQNIAREFIALAERAETGAQVVIFLAGHGSQQPDSSASGDQEPDGLDEIFLPADVEKWNDDLRTVENAIIDDEIAEWVKQIEAKGTFVTLIVDSCHSGTMMRSGDERSRELPANLLTPPELIASATESAIRLPNKKSPTVQSLNESLCDNSGTVAIYASKANEPTIEKRLPTGASDQKTYGLLTYTLNEVLSQNTGTITYRELLRAVQTRYSGSGRNNPTPFVEGGGKDRAVFGETIGNWSSRIHLKNSPKGWNIDAGKLQGIDSDYVLAVKDKNSETCGYVRVQSARMLESDVLPVAYGDTPEKSDFADNALCEVAFRSIGELRLHISVIADSQTSPEIAELVTKELETISQSPKSLISLVSDPEQASWHAMIKDRVLFLCPKSSLLHPMEIDTSLSTSLDANSMMWLKSVLERIAAAENLKKIVALESSCSPNAQVPRIDLHVDLLDREQATRVAPGEKLLAKSGERVSIRLTNPCEFAVDATLLFIDEDFQISAIFPDIRRGESNRVEPKQELPPIAAKLTSNRLAEQHLICISVMGKGVISDFSSLASGRQRNGANFQSPLGQLLNSAMGTRKTTRGIARQAVPQHSFQMISWEVERQ